MEDMMQYTKELNIFGKSVLIKNYGCSLNGGDYEEVTDDVKIRLSICPTHFCTGKCSFCSARSMTGNKSFLDTEKLRRVLTELHSMDIIAGIAITGGEPFTDVKLLNDIIEIIFDIFGLELEVSINTNGIGLKELRKIEKYLFIDTIHISRHHYDDTKNRELFGIDVPDEKELSEIVGREKDKRLFVFNCLLLNDGIGTKEEMKNFLEFAYRVGVPKVGFITPMPVNDFVKKRRVSFTELFDRNDPELLYRRCLQDFGFCKCTDGLYATKEGGLMHFYGRETSLLVPEFSRRLVYTADNRLQTGYGENAEVIRDFS